jgi:thioesterase domain-containing protein
MWTLARPTGHRLPPGLDTILTPIQPAGTKPPLFLVPGVFLLADSEFADAQFFQYIQFVRSLGEAQPVYGLRTLGLGSILKSYRSVEQLAAVYASAVVCLQPHGPYLLTGDCVGGIFAYEIARQLSLRPSKVALVLLNTVYPDTLQRKQLAKKVLRDHTVDLHKPGPVEQIWKQLIANKGDIVTTSKLVISKIQSFIRYRTSRKYEVLKQYEREKTHLSDMISNYEPHPYDGRLSLLLEDEVYDAGWGHGWEGVAVNGLEIHRIPGRHPAYLNESVGVVSNIIRRIAETSEASPRTGCNGSP